MAEAILFIRRCLGMGMSSVQVISDAEFETEVLKADKPVLAYFWASWCGPCRLMAPIVDSLANSYGDRLKIVKLEVDPNPESVAKYQVEGVPALRLFKDGKVIESKEGAISKKKLEEILDTYLVA
jgi:thioredoxin 1